MARVSKRDVGIIDGLPPQQPRPRCGDRHRRQRKQDRFAFRENVGREWETVVRSHGWPPVGEVVLPPVWGRGLADSDAAGEWREERHSAAVVERTTISPTAAGRA